MYREIGGYLTRCVRIVASIAPDDESILSHPFRYRAALAAKKADILFELEKMIKE